MTVYKQRTKSSELKMWESLYARNGLPAEDKRYYHNLAKGYEGEVAFDRLTEKLQCECLILNDLLLKANHTAFQIDSLIVTPGKIHLYEVKNFDGDYYYEADRLFKKPKYEVSNPLHQLARSESLLRQLLLRKGFNFQIEAFIVFISPAFTLYQAPLNQPFIFPTQINRHMKDLNAITSRLSKRELKLADYLSSIHHPDSPYDRKPPYEYDQLEKGAICPNCLANASFIISNKCCCNKCSFREPLTDAVLRSIQEFKCLFPSEKITTNTIHDWCRVVPSKRRIRRILKENFKSVGVRQWTYYE